MGSIGICSITEVELCEGLRCAWEEGELRIVLEMDSLEVVWLLMEVLRLLYYIWFGARFWPYLSKGGACLS